MIRFLRSINGFVQILAPTSCCWLKLYIKWDLSIAVLNILHTVQFWNKLSIYLKRRRQKQLDHPSILVFLFTFAGWVVKFTYSILPDSCHFVPVLSCIKKKKKNYGWSISGLVIEYQPRINKAGGWVQFPVDDHVSCFVNKEALRSLVLVEVTLGITTSHANILTLNKGAWFSNITGVTKTNGSHYKIIYLDHMGVEPTTFVLSARRFNQLS